MKHVLLVAATLLLAASRVYGQDDNSKLDRIAAWFEGTFGLDERPDDVKLNMVWKNLRFPPGHELGKYAFLHTRATPQTQNRPFLKLVYRFTEQADGKILMEQFVPLDTPNADAVNADINVYQRLTEPDVRRMESRDLYFVEQDDGSFLGLQSFSMPGTFLKAVSGKVEMKITKRTVYNWTRYFDKDGKQVYGSKIAGYTLARRSARDL